MPSFFKASVDAPPTGKAEPSAAEDEPPVFGASGGVGGPADSGCLLKTSEAPWSVGLATTCSVGLAPAAVGEALLEAAALAAAAPLFFRLAHCFGELAKSFLAGQWGDLIAL